MKTIKIIIPTALTVTATDLFELWKGNVADSVAGIDEWLGEKRDVDITDMAVFGLFRLAHAKGLINVEGVEFMQPDGNSIRSLIAKDGRLSWWHKSRFSMFNVAMQQRGIF